FTADVRSKKVSHHQAFQWLRRISSRHADHNRPLAFAREYFPEPIFFDRAGIRDGITIIGMVSSVTEAVNTKHARTLRRHHNRPCGNRDRWVAGAERAVRSSLVERFEIREFVK